MKEEVWRILQEAEQMATANEYRIYLTKEQLQWLLEVIEDSDDDSTNNR